MKIKNRIYDLITLVFVIAAPLFLLLNLYTLTVTIGSNVTPSSVPYGDVVSNLGNYFKEGVHATASLTAISTIFVIVFASLSFLVVIASFFTDNKILKKIKIGLVLLTVVSVLLLAIGSLAYSNHIKETFDPAKEWADVLGPLFGVEAKISVVSPGGIAYAALTGGYVLVLLVVRLFAGRKK